MTIDLSGLDRIRRDAAITRESLLTEEEKAEFREEPPAPATAGLPVPVEIAGLDSIHTQILAEVMRGGNAAALIKENHLMPSVVADTINEALFDEIGDNVLICDGDEIELVEDYRMDLEDILGDI